eukprot:TRINITY_DN9125_c0_g1_i1.p1 TRINITY_DN9125_c0_g1~~TRINITY_DN9125_c0_g1_i1.p1  ORF type:complete len:305 (-),score=41.94 TRINITY_DN9125_c0_g1_i1:69-983(-)
MSSSLKGAAATTVIGAGVGAGATAATVGGIGAAGFGSSGIVAGSLAATLQGAAVSSGSLFAALQSIGATGSLAYVGLSVGTAALAGIAAVAVGAVGGVAFGVHRAFTTRTRRHDATECLSTAIWLCDVGVYFFTNPSEAQTTDEVELFVKTLESVIRGVRKHWSCVDAVLEREHGWNEPYVGDGQFVVAPTASSLARLSTYLLSLKPYHHLTLAIEHSNLATSTSSDLQFRTHSSELEGELSVAVQYWEELEDLLERKYGWNEPRIGKGLFEVALSRAEVQLLSSDLAEYRKSSLERGVVSKSK